MLSDRHEGSKRVARHPVADQAKERSEFLTARQLAEHLQISESTVHKLRRSGRIPAVMLSDRLIRFNLREVKHALRSEHAGAGHDDSELEPSPQLSFEDVYTDFTS
ncbi:MAG TPA: helix-turn-helix domain-containing protein [Blastocatellia bacterium]|nr:helix-turn-helix domain-containing protein [Blastocatellia bacterium]